MSFPNKKIVPIVILLVCFTIRILGIRWDNANYLHPDERFLVMVVTTIKPVDSVSEYFDTSQSKLNPANNGFDFYVYGYFPVIFAKYLSTTFGLNSYGSFYVFGRTVSAIFDTLIAFYIYLYIKKFSNFSPNLGLFLYTFCVLPFQLSHYFTTDPFLSFFSFSSIYHLLSFFKNKNFFHFIFSSLFLGLAISSKTSAVLVLPTLIFIFLTNKSKKISILIRYAAVFVGTSLLAIRILNPYMFSGLATISDGYVETMKRLKDLLNSKDGYWPPGVQYLKQTKIITPLINIIQWGVGLPLFFGFLLSFKKARNSNQANLALLIYLSTVFLYQGIQYTSIFRYFYPIYPVLIIFASQGLQTLSIKYYYITLALHLLYFVSFFGIYTKNNTRVEASRWIYSNIENNSTVSGELWDDPLPLQSELGNAQKNINIEMLAMYDQDSSSKWAKINKQLQGVDYIILSSNRLWGSIPFSNLYPQATEFYKNLFQERTDFEFYKKFTSYPGFKIPFMQKCTYLGFTNYPIDTQSFYNSENCSNPGIYFRTDNAEESFTVYDHPQVLIFKKKLQK